MTDHGRILAASLNSADRWSEREREWVDMGSQTCASCERTVSPPERLTDGWCEQCNFPGTPPISDEERKEAFRIGMERTVEMLWHKAQEHEKAASHEPEENRRLFHAAAAKAYTAEARKAEEWLTR